EPLDIAARISGDAGCVRYRSRLNIVVDGFEVGLGEYWHTDYYEKRRDRRQVVFSQATAIANE
ncbi:MAG: nuclear transport factor 2 family protein, partial [Gaiellaceae bacterium]